MKKLIVIGLSLMLFSGCSWLSFGKKTSPVPDGFTSYSTKEFSLNYPKDWEIITAFSSQYGDDQKPVVAFRNKKSVNGFSPNINIIKQTVTSGTAPADYANEKISQHQASLTEFKELDRQDIELKVGKVKLNTILILFLGKHESSQTTYKFMQTFAIKDQAAYVVTGTTNLTASDDDVQQIKTVLESLALK